MNRRQFLYTTGLVTLAAQLQGGRMADWASQPVEAVFQGLRYRGSKDGKIFISSDHGKTWAVHTNLGSMFQILAFDYGTGKRLACTVGFKGRQFRLILANSGKTWQSLGV